MTEKQESRTIPRSGPEQKEKGVSVSWDGEGCRTEPSPIGTFRFDKYMTIWSKNRKVKNRTGHKQRREIAETVILILQ